VLTRGEQLARRVEATPLTVREWDRQKRCYEEGLNAGFDFAYAFFYLNRTNRSGIMNGGIIGGREQTGAWRIDARFNRADLAKRIRAVANFRRAISVTRMDALEFLESLETSKPKLLTYLDPPYFGKGEDLYTNYYKRADHVAIAARMRRFKLPWLMTYDDCAEIRRLYRRNRLFNSEVTYSASGASRGREIVVLGPGLKIPRDLPRPKRHDHRPGFELIV
jgi:DNA adenine methylase